MRCDLPSLSVMLMVVVAGATATRSEGDTATNSAEKTSSSSARSSLSTIWEHPP